jgi:hypothetical protein
VPFDATVTVGELPDPATLPDVPDVAEVQPAAAASAPNAAMAMSL